MPLAKPKFQRLAIIDVTKPRAARTVPAALRSRRVSPPSCRSVAASHRSIAAPRWRLAAPLAAAIAVVLSCGDDATGPTPPAAPQPATLRVAPAEVHVTVGDSVQLAAVVRDQNDQVMTGVTVTWASSNMAVASVTPDGLVRGFPAGLVVGTGAGSAIITATAGQASGSAAATASLTPADRDRAVLESLYEATNGPGWEQKTNWLTDAPIGQWHGVTTDSSSGAVVELVLWNNRLAGALPPQIGNLADLRRLELPGNALAGSIPPELGQLASLTSLLLAANQLAGDIPAEIANLTNLEELVLSRNRITGALPSGLGSLANLNVMGIDRNELDGTIPPELGNLANLEILALTFNRLTGTIPPELGNLESLEWLLIGGNQLTGTIPPELGNLDSLETLSIGGNQLTGTIPSALGNLANIQNLQLFDNQLTGTIPPELGNLANIRQLWLFDNQLTGTIPPEFGNLAKMQVLPLHSNRLTGAIPATLLRLDQLLSFTFGDNAGLCAPGTSAFVTWAAGRRIFSGDYCNRQDVAALGTLHKFTGGMNWTNSSGWLGGLVLDEWHGIGADSLGRVASIDLAGNGLAGRLPAALGQLAEMRELRIGNNSKLEGPLPPTLTSTKLAELRYAGTGLCALDTQEFRDWLATVASHEGTGTECMYTDRDVLAALYSAAGGAGWTNSDNWLTDAPVGEWYGVTAEQDGSVRGLNLDENGLKGTIPAELGSLGQLARLSLADNDLEGEIPAALGDLDSLRFLSFAINRLTGTIPPELGNLANLEALHLHSVLTNPSRRNQLAGPIPPELANLGNLAELSLAGNMLSGQIPPALGTLSRLTDLLLEGNRLTGGIPVELSGLSNLQGLNLAYNGLTGPIPPELGNLSNLINLGLAGNFLTGSIPASLGNLAQLDTLWLGSNQLEGAIPPEIVRLPSLKALALEGNGLTGAIPAEFPVLEALRLSYNRFTGMIPAALGNISSLEAIYLEGNQLTGALPAELGSLGNLVELILSNNSLAGPVPAAFGGLAKLEKFSLSNNSELAGSLPASLTGLGMLAEFLTGGTALCAPADPAFLRWLDGMQNQRVRICESGGGSAAYLTQAVQSREFPVPLVAGEPALLRVFVSASGASGEGMPPVRARFYRDGSEVHVVNIDAPSAAIPTRLNEGDLEVSANAPIPASVIQPGLEMVVEIDPDSTLDASLGIVRRIPAEGRAPVSVRVVPELDFTIVPFLWREAPDSGIVRLAAGLTADNPMVFGPMNTLLPVRDIDLKVHEPVVTARNDAFSLVGETRAIRTLEGAASDAYYQGIMSGPRTGILGIASVPGRASFSIPNPLVMAHELGHNFSLQHAPCGGASGSDPDFPTPDGTIGAWGYDMRGNSLVAPRTYDLMSYCDPQWISDYHFATALGYRVYEEADSAAAMAVASGAAVGAGPERALLLWGGIGEGGEPFLEPTFIADAPPSLPESPEGEYTIAGRDADGGELFSLSFDMPVLSHGEGRSAFAYALPARQEWAGSLASITLSGPGGSFTLDGSSDRAAAILRDPLTGQVRAIFRNAPPGLLDAAGMAAPLGREAAAALSLEPGLEVLASRGLPRPEDWRR